MKKEYFYIFLLIILIFSINYSWLDAYLINTFSDNNFVKIEEIVDGDTIKTNETSIRLLGINSPEKGEKYYSEAKKLLEAKVLNETVRLEYGKEKNDMYGRTLAYVFLNGKNINLKLVEEGLANYYFPAGKDKYYDKFNSAWKNCNKNLCEKSKENCALCIRLKKFSPASQKVVFYNKCDFDCNLNGWVLHDEGRKRYYFEDFILNSNKEFTIKVGEQKDTSNVLYWKDETYVWTGTGDTLFLRDSSNNLVIWKSY